MKYAREESWQPVSVAASERPGFIKLLDRLEDGDVLNGRIQITRFVVAIEVHRRDRSGSTTARALDTSHEAA